MKDYNKMCICPNCSSYVECKERTFCLTKKSKCIKEQKGCVCGACPVHSELKLTQGYYCFKGKEKK